MNHQPRNLNQVERYESSQADTEIEEDAVRPSSNLEGTSEIHPSALRRAILQQEAVSPATILSLQLATATGLSSVYWRIDRPQRCKEGFWAI